MADYAGAKAAIRSRLEANWTTTRITYMNERPAEPWPPVDTNGAPAPWVNLEIQCNDAPIYATGQAGNNVYRYEGVVMVHVFMPEGMGTTLADQYAVTIGEIFRRKTFYNSTLGHWVRTEDPFPAGGNSRSDDGLWFGTTMSCQFAYWYRG